MRILTNPPPSTGGILIAFALALLQGSELGRESFGGKRHLEQLASAMMLTKEARIEINLHENQQAAATLLDDDFLETYRGRILGRLKAHRGTTHISVIDASGNAAALDRIQW